MQLGHTAKIGIFQCFFFIFLSLLVFVYTFAKKKMPVPPSNQMLSVYNAGHGVRQIKWMSTGWPPTHQHVVACLTLLKLWHTKEPGSTSYLYFSTVATILTIVAHFWSYIKNWDNLPLSGFTCPQGSGHSYSVWVVKVHNRICHFWLANAFCNSQ